MFLRPESNVKKVHMREKYHVTDAIQQNISGRCITSIQRLVTR